MEADKLHKFASRFSHLKAKKTVTMAEYIWVDGTGEKLRSKTMCIPKACKNLEDFPTWLFDGSSLRMRSEASDSEINLRPVYFCPDPFRIDYSDNKEGEGAYLVLCDTYHPKDDSPAAANFRYHVEKIFSEAEGEKPCFGFEQEYILMRHEGTIHQWPMGFPREGFARAKPDQYYCALGASNSIGRYIAEAHTRCCLAAGLDISGTNAEGFPGGWEYQIGPVVGIEACDQLLISRYLLLRVCEEFDLDVNFEAKPIEGKFNGSGCHINFSTESMAKEGGYSEILAAMEPLKKAHKLHVNLYGRGNEDRLGIAHESPPADEFTYGIADREASVRINNKVVREKKGYFEDRRPSGNCDPYLAGGVLVDTVVLKGKYGAQLNAEFNKFYKAYKQEEKKKTKEEAQ